MGSSNNKHFSPDTRVNTNSNVNENSKINSDNNYFDYRYIAYTIIPLIVWDGTKMLYNYLNKPKADDVGDGLATIFKKGFEPFMATQVERDKLSLEEKKLDIEIKKTDLIIKRKQATS
jgi:hypothetical protein